MVKTINLISGPRNVSTALMYSFAERPDTRVIDEPLYGHYLRLTHAPQPHWDELIHLLETDGEKAVRESILTLPPDCDVYFIKNMAHHLIELDDAWLSEVENVFLIRDPEQMLPSLINQIAEPIGRDVALEAQANWFDRVRAEGKDPVVLDSKELLLDPEKILQELCERIGINFDPGMLSWEAGPREEDGPWAKYWYQNLHKSTGFAPYCEKTDPFPERLVPLLEETRPFYEKLYAEALKA
ncbi:MAG: sulfotransferase family protein [Verrucomicrobiales bacterium]|nr:sulfotransferase family protein [Verrucomicrobiales bacterium]